MREIELSHGFVAFVDDEDFDRVSNRRWRALIIKGSDLVYAVATIRKSDGKQTALLMHRLIVGVNDRKVKVDHWNRIGTDNQKLNLRVCSHSENLMNQRKQARSTSSQFKGVYWHRKWNKWAAGIWHNGKSILLGSSLVEEEAARMYDLAAQEKFGEFARINFPLKIPVDKQIVAV